MLVFDFILDDYYLIVILTRESVTRTRLQRVGKRISFAFSS